jgi:uncharacterized membrane protein
MTVHAATFLTILLMAALTYLTRIVGYAALRNRALSARALAIMEAAPGCVLISVIAPRFVSSDPADLLALTATVAAAVRLPMLPAVLIGVATAALFRHLLN